MHEDRLSVFAFLNLDHPAVAWAAMRGRLISATKVGNKGAISLMHAGLIEHQNNIRIFNEEIIDRVRASAFDNCVSRMRGMYFFETREAAKARIGDPEWPTYFRSENLIELTLDPIGEPTVVDANWITAPPRESDGRLSVADIDWTKSYWRGKKKTNNPIWEIIAEGSAQIVTPEIREKCWDIALQQFPESETFMLMAQIGAETDTDGGLISPFLIGKLDSVIRLSYFLNDKAFHDEESISRIRDHAKASRLHELMQNEWKIPDFRPWMRVFTLGTQASAELASLKLPSVHFS